MKSITLFIFALSFSMSFAQSGPGGVGTTDGTSTLEFWVDASEGVSGSSPITSWLDQSGNGITNTILGNPSLSGSAYNGYDAINFDGTGDYISTSLNISGNTFPRCDIYAVYEMTGTSSAVWGEDNGGYDRFLADANGAGGCNTAVASGTGCVNRTTLFPSSTPTITSAQFAEDINSGSSVIVNGVQSGASFRSNHENESSNDFDVGSIGRINFVMIGNIAEVFVFSENLNSAQQVILHNYLSAKYNIGLTGNDVYDEDDNGYDHDVAGIGRVDASNIHEDSQGTGLVRIQLPNNLGNNEYLIWGHDNGALSSFGVTDLPATIESRLARDWSVSETGDVGTVTISVDLSGIAGSITANDLRLLIDDDGIYSASASLNGPPTDLGGGVYEWTGVSFSDNDHFTIGSVDADQTPLPIELISFDADLIDMTVNLSWQTASEINNDFFSVERSQDAESWEEVLRIDGSGNSSTLLSYAAQDQSPLLGTSYYRLKQTDFDGVYEYSSIKRVELKETNISEIKVYPNPADNQIRVEASEAELSELKILNALGQDFSSSTVMRWDSETVLSIDLSKLNAGIYLLKTKTNARKFLKQGLH